MQGDQYLEKVILNFEIFSLLDDTEFVNASKVQATTSALLSTLALSDTSSDDCLSGSSVAVALTAESARAVLSPTDESVYDVILCGQIANGLKELGPYTSIGPRIVVVFGSADLSKNEKRQQNQHGFKAKIEFKTGSKNFNKINKNNLI